MNDKQLDQARISLRQEMNAAGYGWINNRYIKPPKKYALREEVLDCIDMINSLLAYGYSGCTDGETVLKYQESSWHNYLADYVAELGRDKVIALIQEQINSIDRIVYGVYTDGEDCTYNSIVWKEDY